jgi:hypothetical protein
MAAVDGDTLELLLALVPCLETNLIKTRQRKMKINMMVWPMPDTTLPQECRAKSRD